MKTESIFASTLRYNAAIGGIDTMKIDLVDPSNRESFTTG